MVTLGDISEFPTVFYGFTHHYFQFGTEQQMPDNSLVKQALSFVSDNDTSHS